MTRHNILCLYFLKSVVLNSKTSFDAPDNEIVWLGRTGFIILLRRCDLAGIEHSS